MLRESSDFLKNPYFGTGIWDCSKSLKLGHQMLSLAQVWSAWFDIVRFGLYWMELDPSLDLVFIDHEMFTFFGA